MRQKDIGYPGATSVVTPATGTTTWYLVPRHGDPSGMGLTAEARLGLITALTIAAGGLTFGAYIIRPKTP
jgi:hypothetical protein